jgi:hypothetical protein
MFRLRCTRKLLQRIKDEPLEGSVPTTTALGDWYANVIPMPFGELLLFLNERSLLTAAIPGEDVKFILPQLRQRVDNLLKRFNVPNRLVIAEIRNMGNVLITKTASRSVLGSMNDVAFNYQAMVEYDKTGRIQKLGELELKLSSMPHKPLNYGFPIDIALKLLEDEYGQTDS